MAEVLRLVLEPHATRHGQFNAYLDGELVCVSADPLHDGARRLLELGYSPEAKMTTRHANKLFDSFVPARLSRLARWTACESSRDGIALRKYAPRPTSVSPPVSGDLREAAE